MKHPEEIGSGVARLRTGLANVYFVGQPDGAWVLIDAGDPGRFDLIRRAAMQRHPNRRPLAIVLTHGHFDHAGAARQLAKHWDVRVYAHRLEMPYLSGRSEYPPPDPTAGGAMAFFSRFMPARTFNVGPRLEALPESGDTPHLPGWRIMETPGHSPGHVSFWREETRCLIAGDAFNTFDMDSIHGLITQEPKICRPPSYYTCDWDLAEESVRRLAELRPLTVAAGHGAPMSGAHVAEELSRLASAFPRPVKGRYAVEAPLTDDNGVLQLPPPAPDPVGMAMKSALLGAVGLGAIAAARRMSARKRVG